MHSWVDFLSILQHWKAVLSSFFPNISLSLKAVFFPSIPLQYFSSVLKTLDPNVATNLKVGVFPGVKVGCLVP